MAILLILLVLLVTLEVLFLLILSRLCPLVRLLPLLRVQAPYWSQASVQRSADLKSSAAPLLLQV